MSRTTPGSDPIYKRLYAFPEMVEDLARSLFPRDALGAVDWPSLERLPTERVGADFRRRLGDAAWRVRARPAGGRGGWLHLLVLLEFQSTDDRAMALRVMEYTTMLYLELARQGALDGGGRLPPVLPVVLYDVFRAYLGDRGGVVMVAPLRMRIREGKFREPDLLLLRRDDPRFEDRYWLGADLVAEVVSPDNPDRDLVDKRADYAEAGISEYWIADPRDETIRVLHLGNGAYREVGVCRRGDSAQSQLLDGLRVNVAAVFDAPKPHAGG